MLNFVYILAAAVDMDEPVMEGQVSKLFGYNVRDIAICAGEFARGLSR
jgi:hypothetical protein